ncbi:MAG: hypothetical protein OXF30_02125 [Candidatus Saccharibacteria bacterium]|nr:hypothetical protein [Candidatus Saccharibacteria bacterium]
MLQDRLGLLDKDQQKHANSHNDCQAEEQDEIFHLLNVFNSATVQQPSPKPLLVILTDYHQSSSFLLDYWFDGLADF